MVLAEIDAEVEAKNVAAIQDWSPAQLSEAMTEFELKWDIGSPEAYTTEGILKLYGFQSPSDISKDRVYLTISNIMRGHLQEGCNRLVELQAFDYVDPRRPGITVWSRYTRAISVIHSTAKALINLHNANEFNASAAYELEFDNKNLGAPITYNPTTGEEETNDYQKVLMFALEELYNRGFKKYRGYVCRQVRTESNKPTRAWEKIDRIENYVETMFSRISNFPMWQKFAKNGGVRKSLIEHLECCHDTQFPELKKNRHVFSFRNGLYYCSDPEHDLQPWFYPYDSPAFAKLSPTIVSAKYFDMDFHTKKHESWYDIPTPTLDRILDYQGFPRDVKECIMYFIGRMLYSVNEKEKWQVIMFLKGMASTGKGMICQLATYFYEDEDVGTLSDTPEKQFGLSAIYDKFCFIGPEITSKFGLGQADFQSLVSGENVSVGKKFKTAESKRWEVPGILAGNEPPGYHDNSGSVQRRLVTIPFPKQVRPEHVDTELPDKLKAEVPMILRKVNEAYLEAVTKNTRGGIWAHLPKLIRDTREEMALSTNSLRHFMASPSMVYGEDKEIPLVLFVQHFNEHCKANHLGRYKFTPDFYNGPFSTKSIEVKQKSIVYHGNNKPYSKHQIVIGLDVIDDDADVFSNNY